jgi:hypothetical protein
VKRLALSGFLPLLGRTIFIIQGAHSRFAKAGVSCFYDSEVLNSSFVHVMKFSAENPRLRKAAKRYSQC